MNKLRKLSVHTHKAISLITMLTCSVLGMICSQFSPWLDLGMILCFIGLIVGIIWHIVFVRCPHCGHHFNPRARISNFCPDCGGELE